VTHTAFAAARFARSTQLAGTTAAIAGHVESHLARGLLNCAAAVACRADLRRPHRARSVAGLAGIEPRDLNFLYSAANRVPKINLDAVFEVRTFFRFVAHTRAAAPAEERTEQVAKTPAAYAATAAAAEVEAFEIEVYVAAGTIGAATVSAGGALSL